LSIDLLLGIANSS